MLRGAVDHIQAASLTLIKVSIAVPQPLKLSVLVAYEAFAVHVQNLRSAPWELGACKWWAVQDLNL